MRKTSLHKSSFVLAILLLCINYNVIAQSKQEQDAIKNLCGCYEVSFKYAETFATDTTYKFPEKYTAKGLEWVTAEEATDKKFVLQHLLVISDKVIIKHWREDWEFEKDNWWMFNHDATWKHVKKSPAKGEWTQTVWEVDDAPRYQGSSKWVNNNAKYYWENTTDAPLPRREYSKRWDYNVMQRTNRIAVSDTGWIHEQDNNKIIREDNKPDELVAEEKGYNIYKKVADVKCTKAADWWTAHKTFWTAVRTSWEKVMADKQHLHLIKKVDDKFLTTQIEELEKQNLAGTKLQEKIIAIITKYVDSSTTNTTASK